MSEIRKADLALAASYAAKTFSKTDRATARQGLYVLATRHFERFLEDQLIALTTGTQHWASRVVDGQQRMVRSRLKGVSSAAAAELLRMNRDYFDPLPWTRGLEPAAKRFLYSGHPFTLVPETDQRIIGRISRVRNCIAHDSESARLQMARALSNVGGLTAHHRKIPIRYLDHMFSVNDDYFLHDLRSILRIATLVS